MKSVETKRRLFKLFLAPTHSSFLRFDFGSTEFVESSKRERHKRDPTNCMFVQPIAFALRTSGQCCLYLHWGPGQWAPPAKRAPR